MHISSLATSEGPGLGLFYPSHAHIEHFLAIPMENLIAAWHCLTLTIGESCRVCPITIETGEGGRDVRSDPSHHHAPFSPVCLFSHACDTMMSFIVERVEWCFVNTHAI